MNRKMEKIYFTITGTNHQYGMKFFEPKQELELVGLDADELSDITSLFLLSKNRL